MSTNPFASSAVTADSGQQLTPQSNLSYVSGSTQSGLSFSTIPALLDAACEQNGAGDAAVFIEQEITLSWSTLRQRADDLATALLALGIRRGNRVAIWSPNRVEWLITQFGTARIGAILVNINPAYRTHELEYALNKVRARVLIMAPSLKSSDYVAMMRELAPELDRPPTADNLLDSKRLPSLKHVVVLSAIHPGASNEPPQAAMSWDQLMQGGGLAHRNRLDGLTRALDPDDPINIQFTSGTTGRPKGATLTHFNIVNNAISTGAAMKLTARDRLCIPVPLYHCFGMVLGVLACTSVGAAMVFPGESFDPVTTLDALGTERCTAVHGVPTMFIAMLEHPSAASRDFSRLRTGIMAGAPCPVEFMRRVIDEMNMAEVTIAYGMTETSPVTFQSSTDDPIDRRVSTVGRIQPHCEAKVIDEQGRIVPPGQRGELCSRGYCVMHGYWDDRELTDEAIDSARWMHTGDLAIIDEQGYCQIVGRAKDMLIRGGENVYPREIEEFLLTHTDILDAQVFGIPDERLGEKVCAWVIPRPGQSIDEVGVQAFCKDRIAHFKVPAIVRVVEQFPMTVTGKPQKFVMRDQMISELGLKS